MSSSGTITQSSWREGRRSARACKITGPLKDCLLAEVEQVQEPEQEVQEESEMEASTLASLQCGTIHKSRQLESAGAAQSSRSVDETAIEEDLTLLPSSCSFGILQNLSLLFA